MSELDEFGIPKKTSSTPSVDEFGIPVKKKEFTLLNSPGGQFQSSLALPDFKKGEKIANVGFAMPQGDIGRAIEQDKKVDGSTIAGLYNTLVGSVSSLAGGTAYMADVLSAPIGLPLNVRVANAEKDRKTFEDFVNKARSSASSPEFEQQQGKYDISNGLDIQDIKGLAFQAPKTILDMGIGALTAGTSYAAQSINDNQKELEQTGNADKLSDTQKVGYLFTQATIQAALEKIGLDKVLGHTGLTKKVQQKIASEVVDEFIQKGVKATAKDIENAVLSKATKMASKIKNVGLNAAKSFVAEGSTEGIQQGASDLVKTVTNKIAGNDIFNQEDINNNFWKNILNSSLAGGVMGGVIGGGVGTLNNTNKAIRSQIAQVQSPEDLSNLQTQINEQVELGNITPQEAQAANIKAQQYAEIAAKIPTQVSQDDKYKIIGGIDQRNQLKDAMQRATDEMSNMDESFRKQKEDEIALIQAKLNQVNDYIDGIVAGKEYDYKEKEGEFYKIDPNGKEIPISKEDYDIAKAVQEENKRKESQAAQDLVVPQVTIEEPTQEQVQDDIKNQRLATFTYKSEEEVPDAFKDKISSTGENTLPDGTVEKVIRVTVPQSVADYELSKAQEVAPSEEVAVTEEVKPTEVKVTEEVKPAEVENELIATEKAFPVSELNKMPKGELHRSEAFQNKLKDDISENGIKEPLTLVYYVKDNALRLKEGHHRLDAANKLGLQGVPIQVQVEWNNRIKDDVDIQGQEIYHPPTPLDVEMYEKRNYQPSNIKLSELGFKESGTSQIKPTEVKTEVKVEEPAPATIPEEVFNPIVNKIKKGIQKLSDTAKVSVLKGKNFAKALDEAIKTGGVNLQSWGGFEKKGFEESPQWKKLIEDGTVKLNFDIKGLEGKPVVVINPDNMLTGEVVTKNGKPIVDGNGGINFVTKFGDVWASSDNATANTLARYINEARQKDIDAGGDGTIHVVVTKGDLSKSLTSHTGAKAAMKVLEHFVDKKLVSLSDFRKALTEVGKKYGIDLDGRLDAKSIHDDIAKKFFGVTDSTFSKRGFFVQDMIDHLAKNSKSAKDNIAKIRELLNTEALPKSTERKTGEISFAKEGIIDAIGHLLSDNMTVGVKNSEAYATIEIKHPVEVFNLNKEEGGHESYPFHLRQIDESGNKVKPVLNVLSEAKHVTDILNDANNAPVDKKGGAGKFGSNQIGMAKGFVKPASEHPSGVNMMTDATGKIYGFEQNGKIVLNADLMNGNTPFHEAGHLWLSWAKENRSDLHDAGMAKIENSKYLKDVKNNKVYQENASKLPEGEREAYFKSEALAKAIGDNGEQFVNAAQKSDFKKWVKELWETIATHFGLRDMTAEQISNLTLDEFSKKVVADIVGKESEKEAKFEVETEEKAPVEFSVEDAYKQLPRAKNLRESAQKNLISSNFDKIVEQLIKNDKIQKKC